MDLLQSKLLAWLVAAVVAALVGYVACGVWVVRDAKRYGQGGGSIAVLIYLLGPLAAIMWWFARPKQDDQGRNAGTPTGANDAARARRVLFGLVFSASLAIIGGMLCIWFALNLYIIDARTSSLGVEPTALEEWRQDLYWTLLKLSLIAFFGGLIHTTISIVLLRQIERRVSPREGND